jgi:hypothetical protein
MNFNEIPENLFIPDLKNMSQEDRATWERMEIERQEWEADRPRREKEEAERIVIYNSATEVKKRFISKIERYSNTIESILDDMQETVRIYVETGIFEDEKDDDDY